MTSFFNEAGSTVTKCFQFYSLREDDPMKILKVRAGSRLVPAFSGLISQPRKDSFLFHHQCQSTMSFAEDLYPFKVDPKQPSWAIWLERSNKPFYSFFLLLLSFWPFHNLDLAEHPILHSFCWVWPQAENRTCVYFTWQSTHGWKAWSTGVPYALPLQMGL